MPSVIVDELVWDMERNGWSSRITKTGVEFSRGDAFILSTNFNAYLTYKKIKLEERTAPSSGSIKRQEWLIQKIREYGILVDSGEAEMMYRWKVAEDTIKHVSWDKALSTPDALELIEHGILLLKQ